MNRATIRKLYREAIISVFGCDDKELDADLVTAAKKDVHYGSDAPGQWSDGQACLEIYCESGIPNASDVFDPADYGYPGKVSYNSEKWIIIDGMVNLMLEAMGRIDRFHHEPVNGAVIGIWRD
jgi:hypothetical protein